MSLLVQSISAADLLSSDGAGVLTRRIPPSREVFPCDSSGEKLTCFLWIVSTSFSGFPRDPLSSSGRLHASSLRKPVRIGIGVLTRLAMISLSELSLKESVLRSREGAFIKVTRFGGEDDILCS